MPFRGQVTQVEGFQSPGLSTASSLIGNNIQSFLNLRANKDKQAIELLSSLLGGGAGLLKQKMENEAALNIEQQKSPARMIDMINKVADTGQKIQMYGSDPDLGVGLVDQAASFFQGKPNDLSVPPVMVDSQGVVRSGPTQFKIGAEVQSIEGVPQAKGASPFLQAKLAEIKNKSLKNQEDSYNVQGLERIQNFKYNQTDPEKIKGIDGIVFTGMPNNERAQALISTGPEDKKLFYEQVNEISSTRDQVRGIVRALDTLDKIVNDDISQKGQFGRLLGDKTQLILNKPTTAKMQAFQGFLDANAPALAKAMGDRGPFSNVDIQAIKDNLVPSAAKDAPLTYLEKSNNLRRFVLEATLYKAARLGQGAVYNELNQKYKKVFGRDFAETLTNDDFIDVYNPQPILTNNKLQEDLPVQKFRREIPDSKSNSRRAVLGELFFDGNN